jgi:hypothetical protein
MASTTTPAPDGFFDALKGTYYGIVHLTLAAAAYIDEGDLPAITAALKQTITAKLPQLPAPGDPNGTIPGSWALDWGPGIDSDNSNLTYLCSYRNPAGVPLFFAVVIRGTDTSARPLGVLDQLKEDLDAFHQVPWVGALSTLPNPYQRTVPQVLEGKTAQGSIDGLNVILGLNAVNHSTLLDGLQQALADYPGTPLVVTGHSLGGCQTQIMATYLSWQVGGLVPAILPNPFAPPTAGDAAFAASYDSLFPYGNFWFNTLDLVPHAFADVSGIKDLWGPSGGPACPDAMKLIVDLLAPLLPPYSRPSVGVRTLVGSFNPRALPTDKIETAWEAQLLYQHFPPCYRSLIQGQFTPGQVAPFDTDLLN